jgi:ribosomal protein S4
MNFNKISHNLLTKFSFAQSNIFSLITFSKLNVRKQLNRIKFIRSKITNKRGKKNKLRAKKYLSLLKLNAFNFSKKKKFWVESRLWEKKASLFYGINNIKKFRKLKASVFCSSKLRISGGLRLELQLNIILFKIGIFDINIFMINRLIRKKAILVNNRLVRNPLKSIKVGDDIQVNPKFRKQIHKSFVYKIKKKKIFLKLPSYIEYNFNILYFSLIRLPTRSEVLRFYYGAFYLTNPSILNFADNKRSLK